MSGPRLDDAASRRSGADEPFAAGLVERMARDDEVSAILSDPSSRMARRRMIEEQLRARGIHDERVLAAIEHTPREWFVPEHLFRAAYDDCALPSGEGQTISQPYIVALMTQALRVEPGHRVLEIGTGTGYQTAILAALAAEVQTIERFASLSQSAARRLNSLHIRNVCYHVSDGSMGLPGRAPFDRIMVTAGAPRVPEPLTRQLADAGRMVIPVGDDGEQELIVVERRGAGIVEQHLADCRFVKLVGAAAWQVGEEPGPHRADE